MRAYQRQLLAATCLAGVIAAGPALADTVVQPPLAGPIIVDGAFDANWAGATPLAFISPPTAADPLLATSPANPAANSFFYGAFVTDDSLLHMLFDFMPRTEADFLADVAGMSAGETKQLATIDYSLSIEGGLEPASIDITFDDTGAFDVDFSFFAGFHTVAAAGFGTSPNSATSHLIIEMSIEDFAIPNGPWQISGDFENDQTDPPAFDVFVDLDPNTTADLSNDHVPTIPEPGSMLAFGAGLGGLAWLRRRRFRA